MKLKDIERIDITNKSTLIKLGYRTRVYYCGNYGLQKFWTKVKTILEDKGIKFPYNPACFKHDLAYSEKLSLKQKLYFDYLFLRDMLILLEFYTKTDKSIQLRYVWLVHRAFFYYFIVTLSTPFYHFRDFFSKLISKFSKKQGKKLK